MAKRKLKQKELEDFAANLPSDDKLFSSGSDKVYHPSDDSDIDSSDDEMSCSPKTLTKS